MPFITIKLLLFSAFTLMLLMATDLDVVGALIVAVTAYAVAKAIVTAA